MKFIAPNGYGDILTISSFQSKEYGLGLGALLILDIIKWINVKRRGVSIEPRRMIYCFSQRT